MFGTALTQLRVAASLALGVPFAPWALDRLVAAALATQHEFGSVGPDAAELLNPPAMDEAMRRDVHGRRFRALARKAAHQTTYYQQVFAQLEVDPSRLGYDDITRVPLTSKAALRENPAAFVCSGARPVLFAATSGTAGRPVAVAFSARELCMLSALSALGFVLNNQLRPADIVYQGTARRGIGALTLLGACARVGAMCIPGEPLPAEATLDLLTQPIRMPSKKDRPSVLQADASNLGELVEPGLRLGYGPRDFGIERVITGGEAVTAGLRARIPALFGEVSVVETYGMTEIFGAGGQVCSQGHVHFHPAHAVVELVDLVQTQIPAEPGIPGTLVVTPLPPFRETTLLLRYDTEDVVRPLSERPTCELSGLFGVSQLAGKRAFAIRHDTGWTCPRDVLEPLESIDDVPLPARCGMRPVAGGVGVEVLVRADSPRVRERIATRLEEHGVPLRKLALRTHRNELRQPLSLRCDLRGRA